MDNELLLFITALIGLPGALFLLFGALWLLGWKPTERVLSRTTISAHVLMVLLIGWLAFQVNGARLVSAGLWFNLDGFGIPLSFLLDRLSLTMAGLTVFLVAIVAAFSVRYMHRDPGYFRFFLLMNLFSFGSLVLFLSGSLDLMFGGWELLGLSSVLLVGFFQYRKDPLRNAVKVFAAYRLADLQIVLATVFAHLWIGSAEWSALLAGAVSGGSHAAPTSAFTMLAVLLIIGASGKSAQGPFFGWLARAMEGPTPSSAVFYGAISVHAGAYLVLRVQPLIAASTIAAALLIGFGLATALISTIAQRTRSDAKTSLAFAAQTQVGLIFFEIGLGWTTLALIHIVGHATLRTVQFLRAPSLLHDHHTMHAAAAGHLPPADRLFPLLPGGMRTWLYRMGINGGYYDAVVDRVIVNPVLAIARGLGLLEPAAAHTEVAQRAAAVSQRAHAPLETVNEP